MTPSLQKGESGETEAEKEEKVEEYAFVEGVTGVDC